MNMKKLLIGGIVGTVVYFLLGWLAYGNLVMGFMEKHPGLTTGFNRPQPDMLYLIIGNLFAGFLLAYVLAKDNTSSFGAGLVTGGVVGLLSCAGYDSVVYATTTLLSRTAIAADVITFTIISAIAGAAINAVSGKSS